MNLSKLTLGLQKVLNVFELNVEAAHPFSLVEYVGVHCKVDLTSLLSAEEIIVYVAHMIGFV